ncbi:MAG: PKD domain-containing protein [Ferruginibacter sp.]
MKRILSLIILALLSQKALAQYTVNGNALRISCNEYRLTDAVNTQTGSVWNNIKIDLTQSFDFNFDVKLGNNDSPGADGIAFVLQPISTSVGTTGSGLGYEGISPAVGVTLDTYQNSSPDNDPSYDHIAFQLNGDLNHASANNIAGPVTVINGNNNIEDGNWHSLRIVWNAVTKTLTAYVDGSFRLSAVKDFVTDIFSGNPMVFWGFTGSTGGEFNYQGFKTALNPTFHFSPTQKRCINEPITFIDSTVSFAPIVKFYWDFGDGSAIDSVNISPTHTYTTAGNFTVTQRVIGADGCEATNTQVILIGSKPVANFTSSGNHCIPMPPYPPVTFSDNSTTTVGTINNWYWDFDNGNTSVFQNPTSSYNTTGDKNIKLAVKSVEGCESDTLNKIIHIYSQPLVDFTFTDSICFGTATNFFGVDLGSNDPVVFWQWHFDADPNFITAQNAIYTFTTPGIHNVLLLASSSGTAGCMRVITKNVFVVDKPYAGIKSISACQAQSVTLQDSSYTTDGLTINGYWWDLGNGQFSTSQNPSTTYNTSGPFTVKHVVTNSKGCISDTLTQTINVSAKPVANFGFSNPLCTGLPVQFSDSTLVTGGTTTQWSWIYNGAEWSTQQNPARTFAAGMQTVQLIAISNAGCVSDTVSKNFVILPSPDVSFSFTDACKNDVINFSAVDNSGTVTNWKWTFGDGGISNAKDTQHIYTAGGTYPVKLYASAANGCYSDTLERDIIIYSTNAFAGNDTITPSGRPLQLQASGGISYEWTPPTGLNDPFISNPIAILTGTRMYTYTLRAYTLLGCESFDDINIQVYQAPEIYLPNAFAPNGINRIYKGMPVGIKEFRYLKIFNRYGQLVFYSTDVNKGWDGTWKGKAQNSGVYVVIANGIDYRGLVVERQGTVMLIR